MESTLRLAQRTVYGLAILMRVCAVVCAGAIRAGCVGGGVWLGPAVERAGASGGADSEPGSGSWFLLLPPAAMPDLAGRVCPPLRGERDAVYGGGVRRFGKPPG